VSTNIPTDPKQLEQFIRDKARGIAEDMGLYIDEEVMVAHPFLCVSMMLENLHLRLRRAEGALGMKGITVGEALDS
jgi:hypothetical protein